MSAVATVLDVCLPEDGRQVLRCTSDGGHGADSAIVGLLEVVLGLSEVDDLNLVGLRVQEHVGRLEVSVADTHGLQVGQSRDNRNNHFLHLITLPEEALLLALAEEVLQVRT